LAGGSRGSSSLGKRTIRDDDDDYTTSSPVQSRARLNKPASTASASTAPVPSQPARAIENNNSVVDPEVRAIMATARWVPKILTTRAQPPVPSHPAVDNEPPPAPVTTQDATAVDTRPLAPITWPVWPVGTDPTIRRPDPPQTTSGMIPRPIVPQPWYRVCPIDSNRLRAEVAAMPPPGERNGAQHGIMRRIDEARKRASGLKNPLFTVGTGVPVDIQPLFREWMSNPSGVSRAIRQRPDGTLDQDDVNVFLWLRALAPKKNPQGFRQLIYKLFSDDTGLTSRFPTRMWRISPRSPPLRQAAEGRWEWPEFPINEEQTLRDLAQWLGTFGGVTEHRLIHMIVPYVRRLREGLFHNEPARYAKAEQDRAEKRKAKRLALQTAAANTEMAECHPNNPPSVATTTVTGHPTGMAFGQPIHLVAGSSTATQALGQHTLTPNTAEVTLDYGPADDNMVVDDADHDIEPVPPSPAPSDDRPHQRRRSLSRDSITRAIDDILS